MIAVASHGRPDGAPPTPRRAAVAGARRRRPCATSVLTVREIERRTRFDRVAFFGTASPSWVNDAASAPVTYLYDGNPYWNIVWETTYWNNRIRWVAKLPGPSPGPLPTYRDVSPRFDGRLFDVHGHPMPGREVVASTAFTLIGKVVAQVHQDGTEQEGLRLWRTPGTAATVDHDHWFAAQRRYPGAGSHSGLRVRPGQARADALRQAGDTGRDRCRRRTEAPHRTAGRKRLERVDSSAPYADGQTRCVYDLVSKGLVGSTRIEFVRGRAAGPEWTGTVK